MSTYGSSATFPSVFSTFCVSGKFSKGIAEIALVRLWLPLSDIKLSFVVSRHAGILQGERFTRSLIGLKMVRRKKGVLIHPNSDDAFGVVAIGILTRFFPSCQNRTISRLHLGNDSHDVSLHGQ